MVRGPLSVSLDSIMVRRNGKLVLGPLDLDMETGGIIIVLGPNGAGKTTFLKVLHGVERISDGEMHWSVSNIQAREEQAYVFQSPIVLRRSVGQNLSYPLKLIGTVKSEISTRVRLWARKIGLEDALDLPATRLSGGEKQKLAIGRALIRMPKVLFLDEPCANLDGRSIREIEALLREARLAGTCIIMATHDLGQAKRLADSILFLLGGRLHEQGPASAFFNIPSTSEAQSFLNGDIIE
ncbi:MAG: ATP-binding cassette domain-containing protein [Planktomarina sp.]|nr:ATP-binding cassette domain-containing protein [Planktomarina sp.]